MMEVWPDWGVRCGRSSPVRALPWWGHCWAGGLGHGAATMAAMGMAIGTGTAPLAVWHAAHADGGRRGGADGADRPGSAALGGRLAHRLATCRAVGGVVPQHTFGRGGFVGLVAEQVPHENRLAANSLLQSSSLLALTVLGPGLGGVLIAVIGAPTVLAIDAGTLGMLLVALATVPPASARAGPVN